MQSPASIFIGSFLIGFSGAMMPGPMLTITIHESTRRGFWAGPLVVLGHGILELLLVLALFSGLAALFSNPWFTCAVSIAGGGVLLWMALEMLRGVRSLSLLSEAESGSKSGPVLGGVLTSLSNPYFTLWWATVGLSYVTLTAGTGWRGPAAFFSGHILSDLVWFSLVSLTLHLGRRLLSDRSYRVLVGSCAVLLLGFGLSFLYAGISDLSRFL